MQFVDKVVDMPVVVQRLVPMVQTLRKCVKVQYIDKLVNVLVVQVVQLPQLQVGHETVDRDPLRSRLSKAACL